MIRMADTLTWQAELGGRPDIELTVESELAAMQLDQRLGDRQTETGALIPARQVVFHLFKGLQHF